MAVFRKGELGVQLSITPLTGECAGADRQHAWELYVEIATRVAVRGNLEGDRESFAHEVLASSMASLREFFERTRALVARYPVGEIGPNAGEHLGFVTARMLGTVYGPFLAKWATHLLHWWNEDSDRGRPPVQRQDEYPQLSALLADWTDVRRFSREVTAELATAYGFTDLPGAMPPELRAAWGETPGDA
ncbi:MAG: hypothetical protein AAF721_11460 [Myxococcota bacterium]